MDIWTQQLTKRHLPLLETWLGRHDGALTPNELPTDAAGLSAWFDTAATDPGRLDYLALVYETPVGLAGLRDGPDKQTAALYLLLGEVKYNLLRTATYVTLRMLDRAFQELELARVYIRVYKQYGWFLDVTERMGFSPVSEQEDLVRLAVEKATFLERKYLF